MASENTQPQFTNAFTGGEVETTRQRKASTDHTATDEWDASKTIPSRFQKRKGSIYATPSSRDGHVERNRDANEEFERLTAPKSSGSKRWSFSRSKKDATSAIPAPPRKASQASASSQ